MYDPLTLVFAIPHLAWVFFDPTCPVAPVVPSADPVRVAGYDALRSGSGIRMPVELTRFVQERLYEGVDLSQQPSSFKAGRGAKAERPGSPASAWHPVTA